MEFLLAQGNAQPAVLYTFTNPNRTFASETADSLSWVISQCQEMSFPRKHNVDVLAS